MVWVIQRDFLLGKSTQAAVDEALSTVPNPNHEPSIESVRGQHACGACIVCGISAASAVRTVGARAWCAAGGRAAASHVQMPCYAWLRTQGALAVRVHSAASMLKVCECCR
jgi:hypothetical protein